MKTFKILLSLVLFLSLTLGGGLVGATTPTRVRKADQAEWLKYSAFCRSIVPDTVVQYGVRRFVAQYQAQKDFSYLPCDSCRSIIIKEGEYYFDWVEPMDTVWFKVTPRDYQQNSLKTPVARTYYAEINQAFISRKYITHIRQRRATVRDFYEHWMTKQMDYVTKTPQICFVYKLRILP
jgi:hypothetical protein